MKDEKRMNVTVEIIKEQHRRYTNSRYVVPTLLFTNILQSFPNSLTILLHIYIHDGFHKKFPLRQS